MKLITGRAEQFKLDSKTIKGEEHTWIEYRCEFAIEQQPFSFSWTDENVRIGAHDMLSVLVDTERSYTETNGRIPIGSFYNHTRDYQNFSGGADGCVGLFCLLVSLFMILPIIDAESLGERLIGVVVMTVAGTFFVRSEIKDSRVRQFLRKNLSQAKKRVKQIEQQELAQMRALMAVKQDEQSALLWKQKPEQLRPLASADSFVYLGSDVASLRPHLNLPSHILPAPKEIARIANLMSRTGKNASTAWLFDYKRRTDATLHTMLLYHKPNLDSPDFFLQPRLGTGERAIPNEVSFNGFSHFKRLYTLQADDPSTVQSAFSNRLRKFLADNPCLFVEKSGEYIRIAGGLVPAQETSSFLHSALVICNFLSNKASLPHPWDSPLELPQEFALAFGEVKKSEIAGSLLESFEGTFSDEQSQKMQMLERFGFSGMTELLLESLNSSERELRRQVIRQLGRSGDAEAVEPLLRVLEEKDMTMHAPAIEALGKLKDPRAIEPLIAIFKNISSNFRGTAAEALAQFNDPRVIELFIETLRDSSESLRSKAVDGLVKLCQETPERIVPFLRHEHAEIRRQAALVLHRLRWKSADIQGQVSYLMARDEWDTLTELGASALPALTSILRESNDELRKDAQEAIERIYTQKIETVFFGKGELKVRNERSLLRNPDMETLLIPLSNLKRLAIHADTHDFHLLERFQTYAVNHIGRQLKEQVEVHIYGDPKKLHSNLRNSFQHICKAVNVH